MSPSISTHNRSLSATSARFPTALSHPRAGRPRAAPRVRSIQAAPISSLEPCDRLGSVVQKLHVNAQILFAQELDDRLQLVLVPAKHTNLILLDLRLHFALGAFDKLDDLPRLLGGNAPLQLDALSRAPTSGGLDGSPAQR